MFLHGTRRRRKVEPTCAKYVGGRLMPTLMPTLISYFDGIALSLSTPLGGSSLHGFEPKESPPTNPPTNAKSAFERRLVEGWSKRKPRESRGFRKHPERERKACLVFGTEGWGFEIPPGVIFSFCELPPPRQFTKSAKCRGFAFAAKNALFLRCSRHLETLGGLLLTGTNETSSPRYGVFGPRLSRSRLFAAL